jgi:hypothetical protein
MLPNAGTTREMHLAFRRGGRQVIEADAQPA